MTSAPWQANQGEAESDQCECICIRNIETRTKSDNVSHDAAADQEHINLIQRVLVIDSGHTDSLSWLWQTTMKMTPGHTSVRRASVLK